MSLHGQYRLMILYFLFRSLFLVNIFVNAIFQSLNSQIALFFVPTFMHMALLALNVCLFAKSGHQRDFAPTTHSPK